MSSFVQDNGKNGHSSLRKPNLANSNSNSIFNGGIHTPSSLDNANRLNSPLSPYNARSIKFKVSRVDTQKLEEWLHMMINRIYEESLQ